MRAVFIGTTPLSVVTAGILLRRGHEVIVIERDKEADPAQTDILYCLTNNDQTNIIASLVGKSLGFRRVITCIDDPEYEHICTELALVDTIIPTRTIGSYLADMSEGHDPLVISTMFRDEARAFSFVVRDRDAVAISDIQLPRETRVVCLYRDDKLILPEMDTVLRVGDEVVLISHRNNMEELARRWAK